MRRAAGRAMGLLVAGASLALAGAVAAAEPPGAVLGPPAILDNSDNDPAAESRHWGAKEFLFWWVKGAPLTAPAVTTGPAGAPTSATLIGGTSYNYGVVDGGRVTAGGWLDDCHTVGLEGTYLFLHHREREVGVRSDTAGGPPLAVPTGGGASLLLAQPGVSTGAALASFATSLQGAEATGVYRLASGRRSFDLLSGVRWLYLNESFDFEAGSQRLNAAQPMSFASLDHVQARNNFYGGQIGARARRDAGRAFAVVSAKVALGVVDEHAVAGGPLLPGYAAPGFAGAHHRDRFAAVPELNLSVGYRVTTWATVLVGYSFLYVSDVARPGDIPATQGGTGGSRFGSDDFWVNGVSAGFELTF